ncbi:MAG: (Fe-S)-binding protein [Pseudomonadota bacterium]
MDTPALTHTLRTISEKCINCELCIKECAFLRKYGKPKEIADAFDPFEKKYQTMAFECSLCGLCAAVCPVKIDPSGMFLEMRREAVRQGTGDLQGHAGILKYEKRGTSQRYTYYALPENCNTVFFPGCTLPGTRPDKTIRLYEYMKTQIPTLGIVLDCCTKPSHDLGRETYFNAMFGEMRAFLVKNNIRNVYVACPNCYKVFSRYGEALSVETVYEFLAKNDLPSKKQIHQTVSIQDPCAVRFKKQVHAAVRELVARQGLVIEEMPHSRETTFCCGEGGAVNCVSPGFARSWGNRRKKETNGARLITYCAGCNYFLDRIMPTSHILDIVFEPDAALAGKVRVFRSPFTYLNRIKLKYRLKKTVNALVARERKFVVTER